jgi:hypothetical protein
MGAQGSVLREGGCPLLLAKRGDPSQLLFMASQWSPASSSYTPRAWKESEQASAHQALGTQPGQRPWPCHAGAGHRSAALCPSSRPLPAWGVRTEVISLHSWHTSPLWSCQDWSFLSKPQLDVRAGHSEGHIPWACQQGRQVTMCFGEGD